MQKRRPRGRAGFAQIAGFGRRPRAPTRRSGGASSRFWTLPIALRGSARGRDGPGALVGGERPATWSMSSARRARRRRAHDPRHDALAEIGVGHAEDRRLGQAG